MKFVDGEAMVACGELESIEKMVVGAQKEDKDEVVTSGKERRGFFDSSHEERAAYSGL